MRIVHVAAGAGGMYCGACARDVTLARGLIERGHSVEILPLYTPLRFDGTDPLPTGPVMLGGINAYLEQHVALWRYAPSWLRKPLDNPRLLELASRFAVSTRASDLGPMLVSVLRGVSGKQRRSMLEMVQYIVSGERPDVVSITNTLLAGIAPELKRTLQVPIVCALQGEDGFVDATTEPYRSEARKLLRQNAEIVDLFLSPSESYADSMAEYLSIPRDRIRVVRVGVDTRPFRRSARKRVYPFTVGYLGVITHAKGADILVDAALRLLEDGRDLEVVLAGKVLAQDYWRRMAARLESSSHGRRFRYLGEVDFEGKLHFLRACSAVCMPSRISEARGMVALEAQAAGVPVIVPDRGVFPEMLTLTGGGITFPAEDPAGLAASIARLMDDTDLSAKLADAAPHGVQRSFSADRMVAETLEILREITQLTS